MVPLDPHRPLRALIVEDSEDDLLLTVHALRHSGLEVDFLQVMAAPELEAALRTRGWDVVICDHNLPGFDSWRALALVKRLQPELPFIIVSGDFGDQAAAEAIATGAADVVGKDKLERLVPVLKRELRQQRLRRELDSSRQNLERLAYFDVPTGLPNEQSLLRELESRCLGGRSEPFGLILAEVRRFRRLASAFGPSAARHLVMEQARTLPAQVSTGSYLARIGSERVALIVPAVADRAQLRACMRDLQASLSTQVELDGVQMPLTWDLGGCVYPVDGHSGRSLYRDAELALARAASAADGLALCETEAASGAVNPAGLGRDLRRALQRQEFFLVYQPQFDLRSGRCTGAEALLRWRDPVRGVVSPAEFVPVLEESGLIVPVGEWVLRSACRQAAIWRRNGSTIRVAVNLSMAQFEQTALRQTVEAAMAEHDLPPSALELEITESIAMNDRRQVVATLGELRELGVSLAIDDFGTGYSSLAYLKHFPVDKLKIDQSFVKGIDQDSRDRAIVSAIVAMAKALGLGLVAEGVESEAHLAFLREQGCEQGQGYHLGRPMLPEQWTYMPADSGVRCGGTA